VRTGYEVLLLHATPPAICCHAARTRYAMRDIDTPPLLRLLMFAAAPMFFARCRRFYVAALRA